MERDSRIARLSELEPGQQADCFVLLTGKERSKTREGKPFYRLAFRDSERVAHCMIWQNGPFFNDCEERWQLGEFFKLRCRYLEGLFGPEVELERIRPVNPDDAGDGFEPHDFYPSSRFNSQEMLAELQNLAKREIIDPSLKELVQFILEDHAETLLTMAAAHHHHHAFVGGFLEHVLSVTKTAVYLADKYRELYPELTPPLSKSLVVAGAILHDIGKIDELDHQPQGSDYTPAGRLIGHILLGRDFVREHASRIDDFDPEVLLRLEHIIAAHQATPEWGSPVPPSTPEALLVHYADDIDAKFHMMVMALETEITPGTEEFTSRDNPLKRRIFRGIKRDE